MVTARGSATVRIKPAGPETDGADQPGLLWRTDAKG